MTFKYDISVENGKDGMVIAKVAELGLRVEAATAEELIEKTKEAIRAHLKIEKSDEDFLDFV